MPRLQGTKFRRETSWKSLQVLYGVAPKKPKLPPTKQLEDLSSTTRLRYGAPPWVTRTGTCTSNKMRLYVLQTLTPEWPRLTTCKQKRRSCMWRNTMNYYPSSFSWAGSYQKEPTITLSRNQEVNVIFAHISLWEQDIWTYIFNRAELPSVCTRRACPNSTEKQLKCNQESIKAARGAAPRKCEGRGSPE